MELSLGLVLNILQFVMLVGGAFYFIKMGGPGAAKDVLDIYKKRDDEQKVTIAEMGEDIKKNAIALATMQGANLEKDKKIQEYLEIMRGNSPEEKAYREEMRQFTMGVAKYMANSATTFDTITKTMTDLNTSIQTLAPHPSA